MNSPERRPESEDADGSENPPGDQASQGPNLTLIYSLLGLALVIAIVLAIFIVLPFYQRR